MKVRTPKNWAGRHTLVIGLTLILLTNAVALLGVYWNRSGEPESVLALTERELEQPYGWGMDRENSGISLQIRWRVLAGKKSRPYFYSGGSPSWLDQDKMASLGFEVYPSKDMREDFRWVSRQLSREVLLVLELDGPAYQESLQRTRQYAAEQDAKLAALPDDRAMQANAKNAHEQITREEQDSSRLFAIDAGLDLNKLRAQYPDRNRYAIVRAQVRPSIGEKGEIAGYINRLSIDEINVPHEFHSAFDTRPAAFGRTSGRQKFEANVAFGQRLEPWITGITSGE